MSHPASPSDGHAADVVLAGGGLANSLIALRLAARRPDLQVVVLERAPQRDAGHTWCLFRTDVSPEQWAWLSPLLDQVWDGYSVAFPEHRRELSTPYGRLTSEALAEAVEQALGANLRRGVEAAEVHPDRVVCTDGTILRAPLVIDGRGATPSPSLQLAWQKFVGLEVRLKAPHGLARPVIMDATVRQADGFRFVYLLPIAPDTLLVEDTYYSDASRLDLAAVEAEVQRYIRGQGWRVASVLRREHGVLPIALSGDIDAYWGERPAGLPTVGMAAALFHPVTGYSLPEAARTADLVAAARHLDSPAVSAAAQARSKALWRGRGFYRALNRMMFMAAESDRRYAVLQRFYRLPQPLIERFYAGRLTLADKVRILAGRPPVPVRRALAALPVRAGSPAHG